MDGIYHPDPSKTFHPPGVIVAYYDIILGRDLPGKAYIQEIFGIGHNMPDIHVSWSDTNHAQQLSESDKPSLRIV